MLTQPGTPVFYLGFNHQDPLWQDARAREAVASAVNTEVIVTLLQPTAVGSCSMIGPQVFGYVEGVESNVRRDDPAVAESCGPSLEDTRPVTLWVPQIGNYPRVGQIIQGQFSQAGLHTRSSPSSGARTSRPREPRARPLPARVDQLRPPTVRELIYPNLDTANVGASNRSAYGNPDIDKLIDASRATTDQQPSASRCSTRPTALLADVAWVTLTTAWPRSPIAPTCPASLCCRPGTGRSPTRRCSNVRGSADGP